MNKKEMELMSVESAGRELGQDGGGALLRAGYDFLIANYGN